MDRLTGATKVYKSHDTPGDDDRGNPITLRDAVKLLNKDMAPEVIKLKVRSDLTYDATVHQPLSL